MSVDRYVVTPSMRLAGRSDSTTHCTRLPIEIVSPPGGATAGTAAGSHSPAPRRLRAIAHPQMSTANTAYPAAHHRLWMSRGNAGSTSVGYAARAARLPTL